MENNTNSKIKWYYSYSLKNELEHLNKLCNEIKDSHFKITVFYNMEWYIKKARKSKLLFYIFNVLDISLPLILVILNNYKNDNTHSLINLGIVVIPLLISFVNAIVVFSRFIDKWVNYRKTIIKMNLFLNDYIDLQDNEDFENKKYDLHRKFDVILQEEGNEWKQILEKIKNETENKV